MMFQVPAEAYQRFMGRYSEPLARELVRWLDPAAGRRALDVGCGPGALSAVLVERLGVRNVAAVDPSPPFVEAIRARLPGLDVRTATAEDLPFGEAEFDLCVASLVVHFMTDPSVGLRQMARVTKPGGVVAATVWDHGTGRGPLSPFWRAVHDLVDDPRDESALPGSRPGDLAAWFRRAGLEDVHEGVLTVEVRHDSFREWWEPFTLGVGPAGAYVAGLDAATRERLRAHCEESMPPAPFTVSASAWCVNARVSR
jgi:SAM-dependent methyltransferase